GLDRFRGLIEDQVATVAAERGEELRAEVREHVAAHRVAPAGTGAGPSGAARPGYAHWARTHLRPPQQPGFRAVVVQVPLGDFTTEQMRALATLARTFGNGTLRTTNDQNVVLPWVREAALPALHAGLEDVNLGNADVGTIADVVSCPGMDY